MSNLAGILTLRRLVAAWSDSSQEEAARFVDSHRDLLPRRITSAQLYGLVNVVRSAHCFADVQRFVRHQGKKAERAGRRDVANYWEEVDQTLSSLRNNAKKLQQLIDSLPLTVDPQSGLDMLHLQLAGEFVQHLIAHSLYWSPIPKER